MSFCRMNAPAGLDPVAYDPADPPTYEGQATFLDQLWLLHRGEKGRAPDGAWEADAAPLEPDWE